VCDVLLYGGCCDAEWEGYFLQPITPVGNVGEAIILIDQSDCTFYIFT